MGKYSWRSFAFLFFSVLTSLAIVLLDPIAINTTEQIGTMIIYLIIGSAIAAIALAVVTFSHKNEKKTIAVVALVITFINTAIVVFFAWFGANFS